MIAERVLLLRNNFAIKVFLKSVFYLRDGSKFSFFPVLPNKALLVLSYAVKTKVENCFCELTKPTIMCALECAE